MASDYLATLTAQVIACNDLGWSLIACLIISGDYMR